MRHSLLPRLHLLGLALSLTVACSSGQDQLGVDSARQSSTTSTATGDAQPDPGGQIISVDMVTDEKGSYYQLVDVNAKKGDVVRFTLKSGVHNVNFLPDSNAQRSGLPKTSDMLQLPGQTYDVKVTLDPGSYFFQCDPHALLGMVGRLHVTG